MRRILLSAFSVLVACGCQASPRWNQHLELLNAEKRTIEDELYALQFDYEELLNEVKMLRQQNQQLKELRGGLPDRGRTETGPAAPPGRSGPDLKPPTIEEGILEPKVEIPPETAPHNSSSDLPPAPLPPGLVQGEIPGSLRPDARHDDPPSPATWHLDASDPRVTHLYLNPVVTGGSDFDRQPGDDGLTVLLEPRNQSDGYVPLAGPVTVILLDPTRQGESARLARWEVDAATVQQSLRNSPKQKGIELRLPWPESPPAGGQAQLFVRYVTVDGRKIEAQREVSLTMSGQVAQRWTPRSNPQAVSTAKSDQERPERPATFLRRESSQPAWRPDRPKSP